MIYKQIWSKKSENQSQKKKAVDTVDNKRPKKAKINGQNSCFNSVYNLHRHLNKKRPKRIKIN